MAAFSKLDQLPKKRIKQKQKDKGKISQELYTEIITRDKGKCAICGSTYWIEVHHMIPKSRGGIAAEWNLISLCKKCHYVKLHGQGDRQTKILALDYLIKKYNNMELKKERQKIIDSRSNIEQEEKN